MIRKLRYHHAHWLALAALASAGILLFLAHAPKAHSTVAITDTHEHIQSVARSEDLLKVMDTLGIEKTALIPSPIETLKLTGAGTFTGYRQNVDEILKIAKNHPSRFIPFCTISPKDKDALDYLKDCVKRGGKGLKLYNGHSLYYEGFGMPLDAPSMDPIYAYAEETRLPVLYHVNLDEYGAELERVLKKHPHLIASIPHFMVTNNLDHAAKLLDQYPNLYTDISFGFEPYMAAGFKNINENIQEFQNFILAHQDRILFGADMVLTDTERKDAPYMEAMLGCYKALLEKDTFHCDPITNLLSKSAEKLETIAQRCKPQSGKYCKSRIQEAMEARQNAKDSEKLKGFHLPVETLDLIYSKNAERFLNFTAISGKP
jgi:predicted TIM-barrel fold metal-dependent hydrolase